MNGICTLGNDVVFDQLVALLNSIDANIGSETPVCIYPFDEQLERISAEVANRPNVFIYNDRESIQRWDEFMFAAAPERLNRDKYRLYGAHRRFCAFDGPFDKFIYMDGDTLAMNSLATVFAKLEQYDWVVYDFQFTDHSKIYDISSPKLLEVFPQTRIDTEIFCSGFYASRKGIFDTEKRDWLISQLQAGESEILYNGAGEQPLLNYMVMKSGISSYNFAQELPEEEKTGCSATSKHFEEREHILYDTGNRLTYLHYIGVQPKVMQAVCAGENFDFPYRDLFLYYRYLHEPQNRPIFTTPPKNYSESKPSFFQRALKKLQLIN